MALHSEKSISKTNSKIGCIPQNYFGQALKELREDKNLTQKEAAKEAGIKQSQWSAYETGKNRPTIDTLIGMAISMRFNPLELVTRSLVKSKYFSSIKETPFNIKGKNLIARPEKSSRQNKSQKQASYS